jgi:D-alanyl-D-alanine carboxypeptidase
VVGKARLAFFLVFRAFGRAGFGLAMAAAIAVSMAPGRADARYASIVIDNDTGKVLHELNADTRNYPASLTKMMTLYLAFEALDQGNITLDQDLPVSRRAAGMPPSRLGLKAGATITVEEAILALITKSANDAAVVVAEALGTKETLFAKKMTKKAHELGMKRTTFRNASGLPNRYQLSTARDMAMLARALIRDFPQYYDYFSTADFQYEGRVYRNHNTLLSKYDGADGLKTGYIRASGFNLVASAVRNDRRLIAVVFGGRSPRSRDQHVASLLDDGFAEAETLPVVAKARPKVLRSTPTAAPRVDTDAVQLTDAAQPGPDEDQAEDPGAIIAVADTQIVADTQAVAATQVVAAAQPVAETQGDGIGSREEGEPERAWGVQVGAFYRYEQAEDQAVKAVSMLPELLADTHIYVPSLRGQHGPIYRARLVGLTEREARRACTRLRSMKTDCLVVQDRSGLALLKNQGTTATN